MAWRRPAAPGQAFRPHALPVHGDGDHVRTGRRERLAREVVAGVLHHDPVSRVEQQPRAEVDALLRAVHHDDPVRIAAQPAGPPQVALEGRPEVGRTARVAVPEARPTAQQGGGDRLPPGEPGEIGARQVSVAEVRREPLPAGPGRMARSPPGAGRSPTAGPQRPKGRLRSGRRRGSRAPARPAPGPLAGSPGTPPRSVARRPPSPSSARRPTPPPGTGWRAAGRRGRAGRTRSGP